VTLLSITATEEWRTSHPGAIIGLLELSDVGRVRSFPELDARKREVESHLRERYQDFTRKDFLALPILSAYDRYYNRFDKTYHVQLQLESIVLKGKSLPAVSPLVDANFMAEMETFLLSAGHDATKLVEPIVMDVSREGESMTPMNGIPKVIRAGDMIMRDAESLACSILYGQDNRSPISPETSHVLYVTYAPPGVPSESVEAHLRTIETNIRLFAKSAVLEQLRLLVAERG
jgi:DNA/RNA-binding domain of Phe-tRNA-synthetase-like protein